MEAWDGFGRVPIPANGVPRAGWEYDTFMTQSVPRLCVIFEDNLSPPPSPRLTHGAQHPWAHFGLPNLSGEASVAYSGASSTPVCKQSVSLDQLAGIRGRFTQFSILDSDDSDDADGVGVTTAAPSTGDTASAGSNGGSSHCHAPLLPPHLASHVLATLNSLASARDGAASRVRALKAKLVDTRGVARAALDGAWDRLSSARQTGERLEKECVRLRAREAALVVDVSEQERARSELAIEAARARAEAIAAADGIASAAAARAHAAASAQLYQKALAEESALVQELRARLAESRTDAESVASGHAESRRSLEAARATLTESHGTLEQELAAARNALASTQAAHAEDRAAAVAAAFERGRIEGIARGAEEGERRGRAAGAAAAFEQGRLVGTAEGEARGVATAEALAERRTAAAMAAAESAFARADAEREAGWRGEREGLGRSVAALRLRVAELEADAARAETRAAEVRAQMERREADERVARINLETAAAAATAAADEAQARAVEARERAKAQTDAAVAAALTAAAEERAAAAAAVDAEQVEGATAAEAAAEATAAAVTEAALAVKTLSSDILGRVDVAVSARPSAASSRRSSVHYDAELADKWAALSQASGGADGGSRQTTTVPLGRRSSGQRAPTGAPAGTLLDAARRRCHEILRDTAQMRQLSAAMASNGGAEPRSASVPPQNMPAPSGAQITAASVARAVATSASAVQFPRLEAWARSLTANAYGNGTFIAGTTSPRHYEKHRSPNVNDNAPDAGASARGRDRVHAAPRDDADRSADSTYLVYGGQRSLSSSSSVASLNPLAPHVDRAWPHEGARAHSIPSAIRSRPGIFDNGLQVHMK